MPRTFVALTVVLVVILAVVVLGTSRGENSPADPGPKTKVVKEPTTDPIRVAIVKPVKIPIECEAAKVLEDKGPNGVIVLKKGSAVMGQIVGYLESPDGWIDKYAKHLKGQPGALAGKAHYEFEAPREDTYYLFLRAKWMDSCGNSIYLRLDDGEYDTISDNIGEMSPEVYRWAWHPLIHEGRPKGLRLKAGRHKLELNTKEDGPLFDKFLLSTDPTAPAQEAIEP